MPSMRIRERRSGVRQAHSSPMVNISSFVRSFNSRCKWLMIGARPDRCVKHRPEYAHTNGMESFWAMMKRHLPPDEPGAPAALRQRVRGPAQSARVRHTRADAHHGRTYGQEAPPLQGLRRRPEEPQRARPIRAPRPQALVRNRLVCDTVGPWPGRRKPRLTRRRWSANASRPSGT